MWSVVYCIQGTVNDWLLVRVIRGRLNVGLDVSLDNMLDCKYVRENAGEFNSTKAYITTASVV
jgi:hypothetical protein